MASLKFYLDKKSVRDDALQVKLRISINSTTTAVGTKIWVRPDQFNSYRDGRPIVGDHYKKAELNDQLNDMYVRYTRKIADLDKEGKAAAMTAGDVAKAVKDKYNRKTVVDFFSLGEEKSSECTSKTSMRHLDYTIRIVRMFIKRNGCLFFEEIDNDFLKRMEKWMSQPENTMSGKPISKTTQGIIFRNMRMLYNLAIIRKAVPQDRYPFKEFKIPKSEHKKHFMDIKDLRAVRDYNPKGLSEAHKRARDIFMLSVYMCGINMIDLFHMPKDKKGYVTFNRIKISYKCKEESRIKLQDEAKEIIERWKGENHLLNLCEYYSDYESFYHATRHRLNDIADALGIDRFSTYDARYAWATYAMHEDVPEYVIDKSLTHENKSLAAKHYITYDWRKTDKANRMVIDFINSEREWEEGDVNW